MKLRVKFSCAAFLATLLLASCQLFVSETTWTFKNASAFGITVTIDGFGKYISSGKQFEHTERGDLIEYQYNYATLVATVDNLEGNTILFWDKDPYLNSGYAWTHLFYNNSSITLRAYRTDGRGNGPDDFTLEPEEYVRVHWLGPNTYYRNAPDATDDVDTTVVAPTNMGFVELFKDKQESSAVNERLSYGPDRSAASNVARQEDDESSWIDSEILAGPHAWSLSVVLQAGP